jgi:3',5'-cyclic-AMP phosphodiesterase
MRFALISDEHFGPPAYHEGKLRKLTAHAEELTRAFVERMNDIEHPDLVINLGDVLEDESRDADLVNYAHFVEILSGTHAEILHVAGNHDQVNLSDADLARLWRHDGPLHYSRDFGGVHFSVLRTVEIVDTAVHLPEPQFEWLERDLAGAKLPVIVLMHHPASELDVTGNRWFEHAPHICRVAERRRLRRLLEASGKVILVVNGHVHWNHFDVIRGIPYVTLQSLIENVDEDAPGRPAAAFAVCDFEPHRLSIRVGGVEPARYQIEL